MKGLCSNSTSTVSASIRSSALNKLESTMQPAVFSNSTTATSTGVGTTATSPKTTVEPAENTTRTTVLTTDFSSGTSDLTTSATNLSAHPTSGLQSTELMSATVTSVVSMHSTTGAHSSHAETISVSSTTNSSSDIEKNLTSEVTQLSSTEGTLSVTTKEHPTEGTTSRAHTPPSPVGRFTTSQETSAKKATVETSPISSTIFSSGITMQEIPQALNSGSIAAITITVIAVVVLVFGVAAFLKIRHSSYGRLFDDHDYGSWGNYNNPLYDDS